MLAAFGLKPFLVRGRSSVVVSIFLRNASPEEEEKLGALVQALLEKEFLGRSYRINSTRSGKEWL